MVQIVNHWNHTRARQTESETAGADLRVNVVPKAPIHELLTENIRVLDKNSFEQMPLCFQFYCVIMH